MPLTFLNSKNKNRNLSKGYFCAFFVFLFLISAFLPRYAFAALPSCSNSPFYETEMPDPGNNCEDESTLKSCSELRISTNENGENVYADEAVIEGVTCSLDDGAGNSLPSCEIIGEIVEPGVNCAGYLPYCEKIKGVDGNYIYSNVTEGENCNVLPYCHDQDSLRRQNFCAKVNTEKSENPPTYSCDSETEDCITEFSYNECMYSERSLSEICQDYRIESDENTECSLYVAEYIDPIPETNCKLKSCIHLTNEELRDSNGYYSIEDLYTQEQVDCINNCGDSNDCIVNTCGITSDIADQAQQEIVRRTNNKYCDPYFYKVVNGVFEKTDKKLRCNFIQMDRLENIKIANSEATQCFLHICPLEDYHSTSCSNDLFEEDNLFYLKWRNDTYNAKYQSEILEGNKLDNMCALSTCSVYKTQESLSCSGSTTPISECDKCLGVDNNALANLNNPNCNLYNTDEQTSCQSGVCFKTVDCAYSPDNSFCTSSDEEYEEEDLSIVDLYNSWFYRPTPPKESLYKDDHNNNGITNDDFVSLTNVGSDNLCRSKDSYLDNYRSYNQEVCIPIIGFFDSVACKNAGKCTNAGCYGAIGSAITTWGTYKIGSANNSKVQTDNTGFGDYHSPKFCFNEGLGIGRAKGRNGICNSFWSWDEPDMDQAGYIKGDIIASYFDENGAPVESPSDAKYKLKACVRYHNIGDNGTCGKRICRGDFFASEFITQRCGYDMCGTLEVSNKMKCGVDDPDEECYDYPEDNNEFVRTRARLYGDRVCVFLDMHSGVLDVANFDLYSQARREQGDGHLDLYSLLDDNSNSIATDEEVFGESLIEVLGCPTNKTDFYDNVNNNGSLIIDNKKDMLESQGLSVEQIDREIDKLTNNLTKCRKLAINDDVDPDTGFLNLGGGWYPIDVIQYIGNNQPEGYPRGYYDAQGNFFPEQQCMKIPLAIGPPRFYKNITRETTPKMFNPVMYVDGVLRNCSSVSDDVNECESAEIGNIEDTLANFIDPGLVVRFGNSTQVPFVPFRNLTEPSGGDSNNKHKEIEANDGSDSSAKYYIEKVYEDDKAKICVNSLGVTSSGNYVYDEVGCIERKKPRSYNIIVTSGENSDYNNGSINVFLTRSKVEPSSCSSIAYGNRCIKTYGVDTNVINDVDVSTVTMDGDMEEVELLAGNTGLADGYMTKVGYSNATCSKLFNECITNKINLYNEKSKDEPDDITVELYQSFDDMCENDFSVKCNFLNSEDNSYGYYHEICVNDGFDQILGNVIAYDYGDEGPIGKCVLDDESRLNPECRLDVYNEQGQNICECSGDECKSLPSKCYSGGYNGYGISYTNSVDTLGDNEYVKSSVCKCARSGDVLPISIKDFSSNVEKGYDSDGNLLGTRQETYREAGLCVDIPIKASCGAVSYGVNNDSSSSDFKDSDGNNRGLYWETDAGKPVSEIHESHVRRTRQIESKYPIDIPRMNNTYDVYGNNFGHADFSVTVEGMEDSGSNGVIGQCHGFWKEKAGSVPTAKCQNISNSGSGEYMEFSGECERYKCDTILSKNDDDSTSYKSSYLEGTVVNNDELKGRVHGYAEWPEFDYNNIDTYNKSNDGDSTISPDKDNDGYPDIDDIHVIGASRCIDGYGPYGANQRLEQYLDKVGNVSDIDNILYDISDIIASGPVVYLNKSKGELSVAADILLGYNKSENSALNINFGTEPKNLADARLPKRYCSQTGAWSTVLNKDGIEDFDSYDNFSDEKYINYKCLNNGSEVKCSDTSTYRQGYENAKNRFCERLYCPEKTISDIEEDMSDDNNRSFWRRTGGSTWPKVNASRFKAKLTNPVYGKCEIRYNFYPRNTEFLGDVGNQQEIMQCGSGTDPYSNSCVLEQDVYEQYLRDIENGIGTTYYSTASQAYLSNARSGLPDKIKQYIADKRNGVNAAPQEDFDYPDLLVVEGSEQTQPFRYCNHLGLWSQVTLPCVKSCGYIGKGLKNTLGDGPDEYTGGARWRKVLSTEESSKAGEALNSYKDYKCTKDAGGQIVSCGVSEFNSLSLDGYIDDKTAYVVEGQCDPINSNPDEGFIQSSQGSPLRVCKSDGTWGEVLRPCILARACGITTLEEAFITGEDGNGYAQWDTGNSFKVAENENGAIISVEEECLPGFWVDVNGDGKKQEAEENAKLVRDCDTRVMPGKTTGTWGNILGDNVDGNDSTEQSQCKMMTCGQDSLVSNIYEPVKNVYYTKTVYEKYSSLFSIDNLKDYFGYGIKNTEITTCGTDTVYNDAQGNSSSNQDCWTNSDGEKVCKGNSAYASCVKNITNYVRGLFERGNEYRINTKKLCKLGYSSNDLELTCDIKSSNAVSYGSWKTSGELCQRNKCISFEDNDNGITWATANANIDIDGNGIIDDSERVVVEGACAIGSAGHPKRECLPDGTWGPVSYDKDSDQCTPVCFRDNFDFNNDGKIDIYGITQTMHATFEDVEWQEDVLGNKFIYPSSATVYGECQEGYDKNYSSANLPGDERTMENPSAVCSNDGWVEKYPCEALRNCSSKSVNAKIIGINNDGQRSDIYIDQLLSSMKNSERASFNACVGADDHGDISPWPHINPDNDACEQRYATISLVCNDGRLGISYNVSERTGWTCMNDGCRNDHGVAAISRYEDCFIEGDNNGDEYCDAVIDGKSIRFRMYFRDQ